MVSGRSAEPCLFDVPLQLHARYLLALNATKHVRQDSTACPVPGYMLVSVHSVSCCSKYDTCCSLRQLILPDGTSAWVLRVSAFRED